MNRLQEKQVHCDTFKKSEFDMAIEEMVLLTPGAIFVRNFACATSSLVEKRLSLLGSIRKAAYPISISNPLIHIPKHNTYTVPSHIPTSHSSSSATLRDQMSEARWVQRARGGLDLVTVRTDTYV